MFVLPISIKFTNVPLLPQNFVFWLNLLIFASPYFDHDVFMHQALHVLNVPASCLAYSNIAAFYVSEDLDAQMS